MKKSKLLKDLVAPTGSLLIPHIDSYLARGKFPPYWDIRIENEKTKRDHGEAKIRFSAGSDALATEEALIDKFVNGISMAITAQLQRTFDVGTFWHGYLQNILIDMEFVDYEDVERYTIHKVERPEGICYGSGLGDLVGVKIPGNGEWLIDIKTMNENSYNNPQQFMMDKYFAQVRLYGDWFDYDKLMILAVNKNTSEMKEIHVMQDPVQLEEIYAKWIRVTKTLDKL